MKVHKVTLYIVDFDQLGAQGVAEELANARYANDCISPNVLNVETRDIGEWEDSHPLNRASTASEELERIFGESALTKAEAVAWMYEYQHDGAARCDISPVRLLASWVDAKQAKESPLYAHAPPAVPVESLGRDAKTTYSDQDVLDEVRAMVKLCFESQAAFAKSRNASPAYVSDVLNGRRAMPEQWAVLAGFSRPKWFRDTPKRWTDIDASAELATTTRDFTNELGNQIKITIEGPMSTSENILTPMEASQLRGALNDQAEVEIGFGPSGHYWRERAEFWRAEVMALGRRVNRDAENGEPAAPPAPADPPASVPDVYALSASEADILIERHEMWILEAESIGADYSGNERKLEILRAIATNQEGAAP